MYKVGIIIGRFQPITDFHVEEIFKRAIKESDLVLVMLGSAFRARTARDPFNSNLVQGMIEDATRHIDLSQYKLRFVSVRDYWYSDTKWVANIQEIVSRLENEISEPCKITLYGAEGSPYDFLDQFPQWESQVSDAKPPEFDILSDIYDHQTEWKRYVSPQIYSRILNWVDSNEGRRIIDEHHYLERYKAATQTGRYPIVFQTVDNITVYKGNVLLVQRRSKPGKGLWALPGGFLNANETLLRSAIRELREETNLKVKREWLVDQETFDAPQRSLRGRTITRAFLWKIPDWRDVPQVKADSDAAKARWFPIAKVRQMSDQLFEDHLDIIEEMLGRL